MKLSLPRWRQVLVGTAVVAVIAGLGFLAVRMGPLAPTQVTVTQVRSESLQPSVFGIGTVEARQTWLMGPTSAGRVLRVHVDVGTPVKAGQLLAEMDPVDLAQRVQAQEAALAKAISAQNAADAQLADARARRDLARANLDRQKELARQDFISQGALESREQEMVSAEASWRAAQANLQASIQETRRLQAEQRAVSLQMNNVRLVAPADAVVTSRDAEPGSTVVAGQPVLRLANPQSLWVKMRVDQSRSSGLAAGLPAKIVLRSRAQQPLAGKVERVEWLADAVTEERIAQVSFVQVPPTVSIGEMAEVVLELQPTAQAPVVPQASVHAHQGRSGVWRLKDGALEFLPVQWGVASLDGRVQAAKGLEAGDTVVVYSDKPLTQGARFQVVDTLVPRVSP